MQYLLVYIALHTEVDVQQRAVGSLDEDLLSLVADLVQKAVRVSDDAKLAELGRVLLQTQKLLLLVDFDR